MRSVLCLLLIATLAASTAIRVDLSKQEQPAAPVVPIGEAAVKDALICNACKDIVDDVENQEEDTIEARVDASIKNHCNNLGFLAGPCTRAMTDDIIVQNINENYSADQICQMADIC